MSISKHFIRTGVVGTIGLAGLAAIAGPERIGALFTQAKTAVNDKIDKTITDPVALRAQLKSLQDEYPRRIADVRGDLAQLKAQQSQLHRDMSVSQRVIEMADTDLDKLQTALTAANEARLQTVGFDQTPREIVIVFRGERIDVAAAQGKTTHVAATRNAYAGRAADIQRDLGYLAQQEGQLSQLLNKLENEQTSFNAQMFDLDRQIDAIGRNDRMIAIFNDRQKSLDEQSRYRAGSLDHITSKLADIRARQESQLTGFAKAQDRSAYEDAAKSAIDRDKGFEAARKAAQPQPTRSVIEINPDALPSAPGANPRPETTRSKPGSDTKADSKSAPGSVAAR
jgi:chromosome segregation ATPase